LLRDLREARTDRRRDMAPFQALTPRERFVLTQAMDGRNLRGSLRFRSHGAHADSRNFEQVGG
jgi:hypothetical protein